MKPPTPRSSGGYLLSSSSLSAINSGCRRVEAGALLLGGGGLSAGGQGAGSGRVVDRPGDIQPVGPTGGSGRGLAYPQRGSRGAGGGRASGRGTRGGPDRQGEGLDHEQPGERIEAADECGHLGIVAGDVHLDRNRDHPTGGSWTARHRGCGGGGCRCGVAGPGEGGDRRSRRTHQGGELVVEG